MNYLDNKKLKELYNLNPNKIPHELNEITKRLPNKSGFRYIYPLWISGELEDRWISGAVLSKNLNRLGYNLQIYYDVLVLNIDDISKRPKCKCGSYLKFSSIPRGYLKYCSMKCQVRYGLKGRIQSEETKRKRSERMKGKRNALGYHHTKEARDSMSKTRRSPEYLERMNSWIPKLGPGKRPKYGYKKGFGFSKKAGRYLGYSSSWEMHFINKCDFIDYIVSIDSPSSELMVRYNNPLDGKDHMYIPDFVLKLSNGVNVVIEIKPKCYCNDPVVISKKDAAIEFYNSLGYRYITLTEDDLFKNNLSEIAELNKQ